MEIAGKVALVTGAAGGIGRATAMRLAREGAAVVVNDVQAEGGTETVATIRAESGRAAFVRGDVTREADVRRAIAAAERRYGGLDILVNNAGVVEAIDRALPRFPEVEAARWSRMLEINLRGVILMTQEAIVAMERRGGGAIVNVASGAGVGLTAHSAPVYATSKAGVVRFSAALAFLRDRGIRVNCVCPGWVDTPMTQRTRAQLSASAWRKINPATMMRPEEIADAVVALVRDERLAGRVMLAYEGERRRLLPVR